MRKIYLLLVLICCCFFAKAQPGKAVVTTVEDMQVKMIKFYPNPATTVINFEFKQNPSDKELVLQIYNFVGKKVYEDVTLSQKNTVSLNDFYRGVYIFQLRDKTGKIIESGKFQVAK